eukprot:SAG31_NODE_7882_length_1575_cov_3.507797_1_plen_221_part_00
MSAASAGAERHRAAPVDVLPLPAAVDAQRRGKWLGSLVAGSDGALYCAPSNASEGVLRVDAATQSVSVLPLPAAVDAQRSGNWFGSLVVGSDGALYCAPANASEGVLRVDAGSAESRLVSALQRLALARVACSSANARWFMGGPLLAAAISELPIDVLCVLVVHLGGGSMAPVAVVQRRAAADLPYSKGEMRISHEQDQKTRRVWFVIHRSAFVRSPPTN